MLKEESKSNSPIRIYSVEDMAEQVVKGRSLPCLTQWVAEHVIAVVCPNCDRILQRETRMTCTNCSSIYPAEKWAKGEPCDCGCMNGEYAGIHSANRFGQLEFQQCKTPDCRWGDYYRRLTVQELADAVWDEGNELVAAVSTCPACGEVSWQKQENGVYLPIENCDCCGWRK
jgi:hypothetical protein